MSAKNIITYKHLAINSFTFQTPNEQQPRIHRLQLDKSTSTPTSQLPRIMVRPPPKATSNKNLKLNKPTKCECLYDVARIDKPTPQKRILECFREDVQTSTKRLLSTIRYHGKDVIHRMEALRLVQLAADVLTDPEAERSYRLKGLDGLSKSDLTIHSNCQTTAVILNAIETFIVNMSAGIRIQANRPPQPPSLCAVMTAAFNIINNDDQRQNGALAKTSSEITPYQQQNDDETQAAIDNIMPHEETPQQSAYSQLELMKLFESSMYTTVNSNTNILTHSADLTGTVEELTNYPTTQDPDITTQQPNISLSQTNQTSTGAYTPLYELQSPTSEEPYYQLTPTQSGLPSQQISNDKPPIEINLPLTPSHFSTNSDSENRIHLNDDITHKRNDASNKQPIFVGLSLIPNQETIRTAFGKAMKQSKIPLPNITSKLNTNKERAEFANYLRNLADDTDKSTVSSKKRPRETTEINDEELTIISHQTRSGKLKLKFARKISTNGGSTKMSTFDIFLEDAIPNHNHTLKTYFEYLEKNVPKSFNPIFSKYHDILKQIL